MSTLPDRLRDQSGRRLDAGATRTGELVGSVAYVAPEQIEGASAEGSSDVYALATVLFECLAGSAPFRRETDYAVLWTKLHEAPPLLSRARADLPVKLDDVLSRGLARRPSDRYASCEAMMVAAAGALGLSGSAHGRAIIAAPRGVRPRSRRAHPPGSSRATHRGWRQQLWATSDSHGTRRVPTSCPTVRISRRRWPRALDIRPTSLQTLRMSRSTSRSRRAPGPSTTSYTSSSTPTTHPGPCTVSWPIFQVFCAVAAPTINSS